MFWYRGDDDGSPVHRIKSTSLRRASRHCSQYMRQPALARKLSPLKPFTRIRLFFHVISIRFNLLSFCVWHARAIATTRTPVQIYGMFTAKIWWSSVRDALRKRRRNFIRFSPGQPTFLSPPSLEMRIRTNKNVSPAKCVGYDKG